MKFYIFIDITNDINWRLVWVLNITSITLLWILYVSVHVTRVLYNFVSLNFSRLWPSTIFPLFFNFIIKYIISELRRNIERELKCRSEVSIYIFYLFLFFFSLYCDKYLDRKFKCQTLSLFQDKGAFIQLVEKLITKFNTNTGITCLCRL